MIRTARRRVVRMQLDTNLGEIVRSLYTEPNNPYAREPMWERRCRLLRRMENLT